MRHLLDIDDLNSEELEQVLSRARSEPRPDLLAGRGVALVFEKPSARTRHSAEMAVAQLGGHPAYIAGAEVGLDVRESVEDVTRTLAGYYALIGARVYRHANLERMAATNVVPIVNLLSERAHPLQALADLLTIEQALGGLSGATVAYIGDANNVWTSLCKAALLAGMKVRIAAPPGYQPTDEDLAVFAGLGPPPTVAKSPPEAVAGADVVYTDVWTSMGHEGQADVREAAFSGYTVTSQLMSQAAPEAIFMHCLPVHRGQEAAAAVVDGPRSRIWQQAANRLPAARGYFEWVLGQ